MTTRQFLRSETLEAEISADGAELVGLRHTVFGDLLWGGDPMWWEGQAPILFPVVGRCRSDRITVGGRSYPMPLHGFARSSTFEVLDASAGRCRLALSDSPHTRTMYPFAFRLEVDYRLDGDTLTIAAGIANPGDGALPASVGFHPGFRWPLQPHLAKPDHALLFEEDDFIDVSRAAHGHILAHTSRFELADRRLRLDESLFGRGAMVLLSPRSRRVTFGASGSDLSIEVGFETMTMLGLWMRPGADFLCIEPWSGHGDPVGFHGEFGEKPGMSTIPPGETLSRGMTIRIAPSPANDLP